MKLHKDLISTYLTGPPRSFVNEVFKGWLSVR